MELKLTRDLLIEGAHHCIEKFISWRVTSYDLTIVELYFLMAGGIHRDGAHAEGHLTLGPRRIDIPSIGTDDQCVRNGRMMTRLLHEEFCPIGAPGLKSFT